MGRPLKKTAFKVESSLSILEIYPKFHENLTSVGGFLVNFLTNNFTKIPPFFFLKEYVLSQQIRGKVIGVGNFINSLARGGGDEIY